MNEITEGIPQTIADLSTEILRAHAEVLNWRRMAHEYETELNKEKSLTTQGHLHGLQRALHMLLREPSLRTEEALQAAWLELPEAVFRRIEMALLGSPDNYSTDAARDKAYRRRHEVAAEALGVDMPTYRVWCALGAPDGQHERVQALVSKLGVRTNREIYGGDIEPVEDGL